MWFSGIYIKSWHAKRLLMVNKRWQNEIIECTKGQKEKKSTEILINNKYTYHGS